MGQYMIHGILRTFAAGSQPDLNPSSPSQLQERKWHVIKPRKLVGGWGDTMALNGKYNHIYERLSSAHICAAQVMPSMLWLCVRAGLERHASQLKKIPRDNMV